MGSVLLYISVEKISTNDSATAGEFKNKFIEVLGVELSLSYCITWTKLGLMKKNG